MIEAAALAGAGLGQEARDERLAHEIAHVCIVPRMPSAALLT
jgi:hypothetical protein